MNKKLLALVTTTVTASICLGVVMVAINRNDMFAKGELEYSITLNDKSAVKSKDMGYLHQITVKNNKFDMIGWSSEGGNLGSIKQDTYGDYTYKGMIYNRSVINGFKQLTVKFSGGDLYYVFTDFLMEDMSFNGTQLTSEVAVSVPNNEAYFLVYTSSTDPVDIDYVTVRYECDASVDASMIFNKDSTKGGARSVSSSSVFEDSFVTLTNNPTLHTNNYSTGKHDGHTNNDSWYRWNGRYFAYSGDLGTHFSFGTTIIGNISQVVGAHTEEADNYFHFGVWPQFTYGDTLDERKENAEYEMIYIGNDNYEPLGKDEALRPSDPYTKQSYAGRFYTVFENYEWHLWSDTAEDEYKEGGVVKKFATVAEARAFIKALPEEQKSDWVPYAYDAKFLDPDTNTVVGGSTTLRQAYEAYTLPYWFVRFDVYLAENDIEEMVPYCDAYINGFKIFSSEIFPSGYDTDTNPGIHIHSLPMHVVNFGKDIDGNPASKYEGTFTYPRFIAD